MRVVCVGWKGKSEVEVEMEVEAAGVGCGGEQSLDYHGSRISFSASPYYKLYIKLKINVRAGLSTRPKISANSWYNNSTQRPCRR